MSNKLLDNKFFNSKVKSDKVTFSEMAFGYLIGPFGALLGSGVFTSFLNRYWTDCLFADQKVDGEFPLNITLFLTLLPLIGTILIVIGNLVAGRLIDRTKSKQGKARPWILLTSILLAVSSVILFVCPVGSPIAKMIVTSIGYVLYYAVSFPLYNTANSSLVPLSTRDGKKRSLLASLANISHLGVMGFGQMVFGAIVINFLIGYDGIKWMIAFLIIGVITFVCALLQYFNTRERVSEELSSNEANSEQKQVSLKEQFSAICKDGYFWLIIVFYLFFQVSGAFKNTSMVYFCDLALNKADGITAETYTTILAILGAVPMAVASVFCYPLSNKIGKKNLVLIGLALGVVGGIVAGIANGNVIIVSIGVALKCLGSSPACYLILAMISDVIEHIEAKKGIRCDGLIMSIYSSIMVAATPIATGIFNAMGGSTSSLISNISYVWIETVAYALCFVIMLFFNVEKHAKDDKFIIEQRKVNTVEEGK